MRFFDQVHKKRILSIDLVRSIATIFVFLFHFSPDSFPNGWIGVDLFFVISGFLISLSLNKINNLPKKDVFLGYIKRRFLRIYIPFLLYIPLTIICIFLSLDYSAATNNFQFLTIGSIFLMTPYRLLTGHNYFELGAVDYTSHLWSISSELFAYLIFPITIIFANKFSRFYRLEKIWNLIFTIFILILLFNFNNLSYYSLGGKYILFLFGTYFLKLSKILANYSGYFREKFKYLYLRNAQNYSLLSAIPALVIFVIPIEIPKYPSLFAVVLTILVSAPFLIISSLNIMLKEENISIENKPNLILKLFNFPGIFSLSFYLIHLPIIYTTKIFAEAYYISNSIALIISILLTIIISIFSAYFYEYKLFNLIIRSRKKRYILYALFFILPAFTYYLFRNFSAKWTSLINGNDISYSKNCDRKIFTKEKFYSLNQTETGCLINGSLTRNNVFILGDSHADMLYNSTLDKEQPKFSYVRVPIDRCSFQTFYIDENCTKYLENSLISISKVFKENDILLISFWLDNIDMEFDKYINNFFKKWSKNNLFGIQNKNIYFVASKYSTKGKLNDAMCEIHPLYKKSPKCHEGYIIQNELVNMRTKLSNLFSEREVKFIDYSDHICRMNKNQIIICPYLSENNKNYFIDNHHLDSEFALKLMNIFYQTYSTNN